jgi:hypothetical protein
MRYTWMVNVDSIWPVENTVSMSLENEYRGSNG